jgi:hypothetical protein
MKRDIFFKGVKVICFLLLISGSYLIYSTLNYYGREGLETAEHATCSAFGSCSACAGVKTSTDGLCAWDSKVGKCRVPSSSDNALYVSTSSQCAAKTGAPADSLWLDATFGCPTCPPITTLPNGTGITAQHT